MARHPYLSSRNRSNRRRGLPRPATSRGTSDMTFAFIVENGRRGRVWYILRDFVDPNFIDRNTGAITMLVLSFLVLVTLLILVPQLLRWHQRALEMQHLERMRTLEQGQVPNADDPRSVAAGRIAVLVPMVVICAAATV